MKVAVIGGGAAGFFAAISTMEHHPDAEVTIFEKTGKTLSKVKVSGGGRCNVTNACRSIGELTKAYPRGGNSLKKPFGQFSTQHTMSWFENRGVKLKTEPDGRVFPVTDNSQTIIDCLESEVSRLGIHVKTRTPIKSIVNLNPGYTLESEVGSMQFDKIIVASGGSPKYDGLIWLEDLGHAIESPVPSLFTFNMPKEKIRKLMGVVANPVRATIQSTKLKSEGPLLITHWGMSGPAILKLSAFGARKINELDYRFNLQVNWLNQVNNDLVTDTLRKLIESGSSKLLRNLKPFDLPEKLWLYLLDRSNINADLRYNELGKKSLNKLVNTLVNDIYPVSGKTTFKEEFVTCGGVSLDSIDMKTMESKVCQGMYFAGEVMDVDAITGGYNFQAAWTTGYIAGKLKSRNQ